MKALMNAVDWLTRTLGKFMYAIPFAVFGAFHFMNAGQMASMIPFGGVIMVYLTGAALIAAAISMIIGRKDKLALFLLGVFLLLTIFLVHVPGMIEANAEGDAMGAQMFTTNVLKDLALAGAAWMYAGSIGAKDKS